MNRHEILFADRAHAWHPYTAMGRWSTRSDVLVVREAEGAWLVDADGRRLLDANSSWWTMSLGHRHPRVVAAAKRALETLDHVAFAGITHEPGAALARELLAIAPAGLARVFYVDNGSTAIEFAIKCCIEYFQRVGQPDRQEFITFSGAFHGDTSGATSLGGVETFVAAYASITFPCHRLPPPWEEERAIAELERVLVERHGRVAGVFLEPMLQGAAGMKMQSARFLATARDLARDHGALFVADEVFAGYGRTGCFWACDHASVTPDILCIGKAFAQFVPMGAVLVAPHVFEPFERPDADALPYGHTFNGNPFGAAIAREVLAIYRDEQLVERVTRDAWRFAEAAANLERIPGVRRARSLGFVIAADLEDPAGVDGYGGTVGWRVYEHALRRGVYLRPLGSTIYACPPLVTSNEDLTLLFGAIESSVRAALA
jgi:adenosylmethionine-8-amino-7-oxononanoate aminotransferase